VTELISQIAPVLHSGDKVKAAQLASDYLNLGLKIQEPHQANEILQALLAKLLYQQRLELAAQLLWPPSFFSPEPDSVARIWKNIRENPGVILMGASSMGKTYTPGVIFYLSWLSDPEYTSIICVGPSEEHLEANLFTHLQKLHENTAIPVIGKAGKRWIGVSTKNRRAGIRGVVIPVGRGSAGRLQGTKRHQRPASHPVFGPMSRLFILVDEVENVPPGIYSDIENLMSNSSESDSGFKIALSYNPKDVTRAPYKMSEPIFGWDKFDAEVHFEWTSKLDWRVVRLDAEKSENVVSGRTIFLGLQTKAGFEKTMKASGGHGSPGYWTFCRGCYPTQGSSTSAIPAHYFDTRRAEVLFVERPASVGGCDMALEGGDALDFGHAFYGLASGIKKDGKEELFRSESGQPIKKPCVQFVAIHELPPSESVQASKNVKLQAQTLGIRPQALTLDRTGNGAGAHDILKAVWDSSVRGVNYSESPTDLKVLKEDTETAKDRFPRIDSELIFALKDWLEHGNFWFHPDFDLTKVREQGSNRKAYNDKGKQRAESKSDYKARNQGHSPNELDATCLTLHSVRVNFNPEISAIPDRASGENFGDSGPGFTDVTNRIDDLDS
jgi:hypothetical protein